MVARIEPLRAQETFTAIDRLWDRLGGGRPPLRVTFDFLLLRYYMDTLIQGATVTIASIIALAIAVLGLFALSAFTTERRIKEIGIRKALGASSADILKFVLWQFANPPNCSENRRHLTSSRNSRTRSLLSVTGTASGQSSMTVMGASSSRRLRRVTGSVGRA